MEDVKVLAECIKTYVDEDDMQSFIDGDLKPCEVRIYLKGKKYPVYPELASNEYYKLK